MFVITLQVVTTARRPIPGECSYDVWLYFRETFSNTFHDVLGK